MSNVSFVSIKIVDCICKSAIFIDYSVFAIVGVKGSNSSLANSIFEISTFKLG